MTEITVPHVAPLYSFDAYAHVVEPLTPEDGGGYLITFPDLPGCMSDGETIDEAIENGREALRDCISVFKESGRKIPKLPPPDQSMDEVIITSYNFD